MSIIISKNKSNARKVDESCFGLENNLQEYLKNNPDIIPIHEIAEDSRLLILSREFGTQSGPIDALGVDQEGNVYVIETKLYKNPDKRTVVAQALDYGASLWRHSGNTNRLIENINQKVIEQFGMSLVEKIQDFFETDEPQAIIENLSNNISEGLIKFVILMDRIDDRLKDLITYVNQNSKFDIYAVDIKYYQHEDFEIVIPKLYGSEVKKNIEERSSRRFDNQKIVKWIDEFKLENIILDKKYTNATFVRFTTPEMNSILPQRNDNSGGWRNGNAYYYELQSHKTGRVRLALVLSSNNIEAERMEEIQKIISLSDKAPKKDWQYFKATIWDLGIKAEDSVLRDILYKILSKEIPAYEADLKKNL